MDFNLEKWKTSIASQLVGWKKHLNQAGVNSVYYFVAASSFLPLIQVVHSGDWTAMATLGSAVGAGLLANMVQKLKDKSDLEVAHELEAEAQRTPALRAELDTLLEHLDAFKQAENALSEKDRPWFVETWKKEQAQYTASLVGSGAIAQNGSKAVGAGGVMIEGGVHSGRDVILGSQTNIFNPLPPDPEAEKRQRALETYLNRLSRACLSLPLAALGGEESTESDVTLDKVYIKLNTTKTRKISGEDSDQGKYGGFLGGLLRSEQDEPVTALESVSEHQRLALLGDPGAGKSTFVKKLLAWQASACLGKAIPPEGFASNLIPILIILRDLAPRLAVLDIDHLPAQKRDDQLVKTIWEHIQADLGEDCIDFRDGLYDALKSGQCLLALDGLDEVPQDLRGRVRQVVAALLNHYELDRIIVTCRVRSYVGQAVLPQFTSRTLAPFDNQQIGTFVQGWYNTQRDLGRINEAQAKERTNDLTNAARQTDLRELSSNPMLLTTMAIIHQREVGLPRERVRLYHLAVEVLLRRWQKHKVGDAALAEFLKNDLKLRAVMESLAYAAHRASTESGGTGTLLRKDAIELLDKDENLGSLQLAGEFLDYVDQRAGLLVGSGGELSKPTAYSFPHRTFQEYLAGAYLAGQRDRVRTFCNHAAEGDGWDLAAQLAFEELFYNRRAAHELLDLAYQLGSTYKDGEQAERVFLWAGQISALVGREAIERDSHPSGGKGYLEKLLPGLVNLLGGSLHPIERAEAGRVLAKLGDPRVDVLTCEQMAFCPIPAGEFTFGDGKAKKKIRLEEYWIGKYPVTNAQFAQFVAAQGYANPDYWQEALKENYWSQEGFKGGWDNTPRTAPVDYGEPFSFPNHPVVGVSWYEALAFTRWLTEQLAGAGHFPNGPQTGA